MLSKNIIVYGSLRKGMYNSREGTEYIGTTTVKGFKLYSLGPYPGAVFTGNEEDEMVVDIIEVPTTEQSTSIHRMELGAGYDIRPIKVELDGEEHLGVIYPYLHSVSERDLVENGDWVDFNKTPTYAKV